jgi:hypothetical protein
MDHSQYLTQLLVVAGGLLQWFRADKRFDDRIYATIAVGLAVAAHLLVANYAQDARSLVIATIAALPQSLIPVLGGTQLVSTAANLAVHSGMRRESPAVPVTNSK